MPFERDRRGLNKMMIACSTCLLFAVIILSFVTNALTLKSVFMFGALIGLMIWLVTICRLHCINKEQNETANVEALRFPNDVPNDGPLNNTLWNGQTQVNTQYSNTSETGRVILLHPSYLQLNPGLSHTLGPNPLAVVTSGLHVITAEEQDMPPPYETAVSSEPPPSYAEAQKKSDK